MEANKPPGCLKNQIFLNSTFSKIFLYFKKKVSKKYFYLYRSEICSGIQKSYLENRAVSLKIRTKKIRVFLHLLQDLSYMKTIL